MINERRIILCENCDLPEDSHKYPNMCKKFVPQIKSLEQLCSFAESCAESDYGDEEICRSDYQACESYHQFKKGNIIVEKLPSGVTETCPEISRKEPRFEKLLKGIESELLQNGLTEREQEFLIKLTHFGQTNFELYVEYYNRYMAIKNYKKIFQEKNK